MNRSSRLCATAMVALILAIWLMLVQPAAAQTALRAGDVNGDGVINVIDVQLTVNVALGVNTDSTAKSRADVNGDGAVNVVDVQRVVNIVLYVIEYRTQTVSSTNGGTVSLPSGQATATIPAGSFPTDQPVTLSLVSMLPNIEDNYNESTFIFNAGPNSNQLLIIDTGPAQPQIDIALSFKIPSSFLASLSQGLVPQLFLQVHWLIDSSQSADAVERGDKFGIISYQLDPTTNIVTTVLPTWGFSDLRTDPGNFEAVLVLGSMPNSSIASASGRPLLALDSKRTPAHMFLTQNNQCPVAGGVYSPIAGQSPDGVKTLITSDYGPRTRNGVNEFHPGADYDKDPQAQVVAAQTGYILQVYYSASTGQSIVIQHNGYRTAYHCLAPQNAITDANGNPVPTSMPLNGKTNKGPIYGPGEHPVTGGITNIGNISTPSITPGCSGRHVHFEIGPNDVVNVNPRKLPPDDDGGFWDPNQCILLTSPAPAGQSCGACLSACISFENAASQACFDALSSCIPIGSGINCDNAFVLCQDKVNADAGTCLNGCPGIIQTYTGFTCP